MSELQSSSKYLMIILIIYSKNNGITFENILSNVKNQWEVIFLYTKISYTSCTSNTVNILLNVTRQIKIDDMLHIADVQTPGSHLENIRLKSE